MSTPKLKARRVADRAVFGDLVGCALSSDDPEWVSDPEPHWRVSYRSFDGTLLATVKVDAHTWVTSLSNDERAEILAQVEQLTINLEQPVSLLSDEDVLTLSNIQMKATQGRRLSKLLKKRREGALVEGERLELLALMQVYNQLWIRQSEALAEAVRRGLRKPMEP